MARLLAFDWDHQEARFVVASTHGSKLVVEAAARVAIQGEVADGVAELSLRTSLQSALAPYRLARGKALVAIERNQIELVSLTLPPSSDAELPELVRNQAMRESSAIGDEWSLDFVPVSSAADEPRKVTAVALSRPRLAEIQSICDEAGVSPAIIGLRPYGAAALLSSALPAGAPICLLVNVFAEEIDLTIIARGEVMFWRTLRKAGVSHDTAAAQSLLAELKRTLIVAQGDVHGETIETIYVLGSESEHPALIEQMRGELSLPVSLIDPFATCQSAPEALPENAGRFSALLGMLSVEAKGGTHVIDFLHPRKKPEPPDRRRTMVLAGAAAALVVLLGGYHVWSTFAELDAANESLSQELDRLDDQFKRAGKQQKTILAIQEWIHDDVNWLDELRDLSLRLPRARDTALSRMSLGHARGSGGTIDIVGVVRDPAIVSRMENELRDKYHQISSRRVQEREQENSYSWHFESSLIVLPRDKKHYVSHLPAPPEDSASAPQSRSSLSRSAPEKR